MIGGSIILIKNYALDIAYYTRPDAGEFSIHQENYYPRPDVLEGEQQIGPYRIAISRVDDRMAGRIEIRKGKQIVFEEQEIGSYFYFDNQFAPDEKVKKISGRDFTGNGVPDLLISKWTGGSNCCHSLYIFELGEKIKKIATVETGTYYFSLIDLDDDHVPEVELWDGAINSLFASFASSPPGRVVLKIFDGQYRVDGQHMKKPLPSKNVLREKKICIRTAFAKERSPELPYEFLKLMMDLSYSGHIETAFAIADETWPIHKLGLDKFKFDFKEALDSSVYWSEFQKSP